MKNVKKPDGTIVEVEDGYVLLEGEEITEDEVTVDEVKNVKKPDGTIVAVENDYELQEDEEFTEEEPTKGVDEEKSMKDDLKTFIKSETVDSLEKELEKKSDELVKKFFNGVAKQRKIALNSGKVVKKTTEQELVKNWFSALLHKDHNGLMTIQKDYMQVGDNSQGGYLVPPALLVEVNRFTEQYGYARSDMRYLPFSGPGNSRNIPALVNAVSVYWPDEAEVKTSTKPTFKLVEQILKKIAAIVPMTDELIEDSAVNIISLLGELFGEAVAMEEDRVFFAGTALDPFLGVINAVGVVPIVMVGVVATIDADDLNNLIYAVPRAARDRGTFYMHSTIFQLIQQLKDGNGQYIVQSPIGTRPGTIWGRPYKLVDILPDTTVAAGGVPFMFYTDLRKTCVYGDKAGLKVKLLDQATVKSAEESPSDLNLATQDMVALRIVKRVGYVPILPAGIAVLSTGEEES